MPWRAVWPVQSPAVKGAGGSVCAGQPQREQEEGQPPSPPAAAAGSALPVDEYIWKGVGSGERSEEELEAGESVGRYAPGLVVQCSVVLCQKRLQQFVIIGVSLADKDSTHLYGFPVNLCRKHIASHFAKCAVLLANSTAILDCHRKALRSMHCGALQDGKHS